MKALIISFFSILLGYSFFFDKEEAGKLPQVQPETSVIDVETGIKPYCLDTVDYYASQRNKIFFEQDFDQLF